MLAHKLLNKDEILDNELRKRIIQHLDEKPGSYLGKIARELDVPTSTLKYHLNILRAFDFITTVKKGRCRHYFPKRKRYSDLEKRMYAAIEHDPTRRVVEIVHRHPGVSQAGLVEATNLSQSTVAWHMAKLEEMNLIRSHKSDVKEYYLRGDFEDVLRDMELRGLLGVPEPGGEEPGMPERGAMPPPSTPREHEQAPESTPTTVTAERPVQPETPGTQGASETETPAQDGFKDKETPPSPRLGDR